MYERQLIFLSRTKKSSSLKRLLSKFSTVQQNVYYKVEKHHYRCCAIQHYLPTCFERAFEGLMFDLLSLEAVLGSGAPAKGGLAAARLEGV